MYSKEEIFKAISTVEDPEVGFNLVEMGLIYDASCNEDMEINVVMTLSTKACPLHMLIVGWVKDAVLRELPNAKSANVEVVWEPVWNISMADESVKAKLRGM